MSFLGFMSLEEATAKAKAEGRKVSVDRGYHCPGAINPCGSCFACNLAGRKTGWAVPDRLRASAARKGQKVGARGTGQGRSAGRSVGD